LHGCCAESIVPYNVEDEPAVGLKDRDFSIRAVRLLGSVCTKVGNSLGGIEQATYLLQKEKAHNNAQYPQYAGY
jgi:hypothetical protein